MVRTQTILTYGLSCTFFVMDFVAIAFALVIATVPERGAACVRCQPFHSKPYVSFRKPKTTPWKQSQAA